jgi:hypothetical protein
MLPGLAPFFVRPLPSSCRAAVVVQPAEHGERHGAERGAFTQSPEIARAASTSTPGLSVSCRSSFARRQDRRHACGLGVVRFATSSSAPARS